MRNRAECRQCHDIIESTYRHDLVACSCWTEGEPNGGIFVDGGQDYWRVGGDMSNFIRLDREATVFCESCHQKYYWQGEHLYERPDCPHCGSANTTPTNVRQL